MKRFSHLSFRWSLAALVLVLMLALPWAALAAVWTDLQDYAPGDIVTIHGDNSDGAGYLPGETVHVDVSGPNGYTAACDAIADSDGAWSCQVILWPDYLAVGTYFYTATGQTSNVSQSGTFTDGNATVTGYVKDASNNPIAGATVTCTSGCNSSQSTTTDSYGYYAFSGAQNNKLTFSGTSATLGLTASKSGYTSDVKTLSVTNGGTYPNTNFALTVSDTTPPTTSIALSPASPNGLNGWYVTDVHVTVSAADNPGGSGVAETRCVLDPASAPASFDAIPAGCAYTGAGADVTTEGQHIVYAASKDNAGNKESPVISKSFKIDKTKPTINAAATTAPNAAGWYNSNVTVHFTCSDALSGIPDGACPADQVLSAEGAAVASTAQTVTDAAGNTSDPSNVVTVKIDKTAPTLTWDGGPAAGGSYYFGFVPAAPTCTASDLLSGPNGCTVTGYSAAVGSHTMTATAYDVAGNSKAEMRSYEVKAWEMYGFYQPVDMTPDGQPTVWNTVKGGSAVPLKFEVFAGSLEFTDPSVIVQPLQASKVSCTTGSEDAVEEVAAAGNTVLRYDFTDGQFIYNWKTPKSPGTCYKVTVSSMSGSSLTASFKLK